MPSGYAGDSRETAYASSEEGGDDVKSARPLRPGLHTCYNGRYRGQPLGDKEQISKVGLSSDRSLQLDSVKLESLVIPDQQRRGEYVPGTATLLRLHPNHQPHLRQLLPRGVRPLASGVADFRGVTGGVYKARERIHPGVADPGLLATPTSRSRVADSDPN